MKENYDGVDLGRDHLLELARQMILIRRFEEKCAELYSAEKIRGFLHLYDGEEGIVQIGEGSLGGKGRGLAFASRLMDEVQLANRFPDLRIRVPPAVVLGTDVFDNFMQQMDIG